MKNSIQNILGRTVVNFNSDWRFKKLAKSDGLSELAFEAAEQFLNLRTALTGRRKLTRGANGISQGIIKRADLDEKFSTIFIWENVKIAENRKNEIAVKGFFEDGTPLEDSAVWTGI